MNEQGSTYFIVEFEFEWLSRQYVIDINKRKIFCKIFQVDVQYKQYFRNNTTSCLQKEHGVLLLLSRLTSNNDATIVLVLGCPSPVESRKGTERCTTSMVI